MKRHVAATKETHRIESIAAVAALVQLLVDCGYSATKIETSLAKASQPEERQVIADCCSSLPTSRSRRA